MLRCHLSGSLGDLTFSACDDFQSHSVNHVKQEGERQGMTARTLGGLPDVHALLGPGRGGAELGLG